MEGVIPNSKVVILPPASNDEGAAWKRELYLRPGSWIPWVTVTVVVATVILAVIVFVLHLNEKVSDHVTQGFVSTNLACRGKTSWNAGGHHTILILTRYNITVRFLGNFYMYVPVISLRFSRLLGPSTLCSQRKNNDDLIQHST